MKAKRFFGFIVAAVVIVALVFAAAAVSYNSLIKTVYPTKYEELVEKYSSEYNIDKYLLYAVIKTESSFDPNAVSEADAHGLTQITPETCEWIAMKLGESTNAQDLHDPETSIKYGAFLLSYLLDKFENTEAAIAAYHAGMGAVSGWLGSSEYSDDGKTLKNIPVSATAHYVHKVTTAHYVHKVTTAYEKYQKIYSIQN